MPKPKKSPSKRVYKVEFELSEKPIIEGYYDSLKVIKCRVESYVTYLNCYFFKVKNIKIKRVK